MSSTLNRTITSTETIFCHFVEVTNFEAESHITYHISHLYCFLTVWHASNGWLSVRFSFGFICDQIQLEQLLAFIFIFTFCHGDNVLVYRRIIHVRAKKKGMCYIHTLEKYKWSFRVGVPFSTFAENWISRESKEETGTNDKRNKVELVFFCYEIFNTFKAQTNKISLRKHFAA